MKRSVGGRRGIALILSFLVLTVLTVVVMQLVYTARVEQSLARNFRDGLENLAAARSGVECAQGVLLESWDRFDSPEAAWTLEQSGIEVGEAEVSFSMLDEESKFNLRLISDRNNQVKGWARGVVLRLLTLARANSENPDEPSPSELMETLLDWAERGDTGREFKPGGGGLGEEARDRRFLSLEELLFLKGFDEDLLFGEKKSAKEEEEEIKKRAEERLENIDSATDVDDLLDTTGEEDEEDEPVPLAELLTVWGDGRINLNTAHVLVLQAMHPGMTAELAGALDSRRREPREPGGTQGGDTPPPPPDENTPMEEPGFRSVAEIKDIEGIIDTSKTPPLDIHKDLTQTIHALKVKSHVFRVRVVVRNERLTQRFEAIVSTTEEATAGTGGESETETKKKAEPSETDEGGEGEKKNGEGTGSGAETPQGPVEKPDFQVMKVVQLD
ncbi:MAG: hypothetical protein ACYTFG_03740 [Planctomycetota bacterium]|jgi:type II secretory pathway component PulK